MKKPLKLRSLWIAVWALMILVVIVGSMMPSADVPIPMARGMDKFVHLLGYFILAAFGMSIFRTANAKIMAGTFVIVVGAALEISQGFLTASRTMELLDFAVNSLGVLGAWLMRRSKIAYLLPELDARIASRCSGR